LGNAEGNEEDGIADRRFQISINREEEDENEEDLS